MMGGRVPIRFVCRMMGEERGEIINNAPSNYHRANEIRSTRPTDDVGEDGGQNA